MTRLSTVWTVTRQTWREFNDDQLVDTAAGVAFWLILSLPAAALAVLSSLSVLGDDVAEELRGPINDFVDRTFTTESDTIRSAVDDVFMLNRPGVLSISVAIAIFTVSRGFAGLIRALDVAYDIEEGRRTIRLRFTAIGLALGTLFTIAASTLLWLGLPDEGVAGLLRVGVALIVLISWAATLFHVGPHHRTPWKYDLPGAAFAAIGWLVTSLGFGFYVRFAGGGNEILGAAGTALLALTWLWLVCLVFLVGAELNQILAERAGVIDAPREFGVDVRGRVRESLDRRRSTGR